MIRFFFIIIASSLLFSGCQLRGIKRPQREVPLMTPESWISASKANQGKIKRGWLKNLGDPKLIKITEEVLNNNHDLRVSALLLQSAKEGTIIGRAARFPSINLGGSGSRSRSNQEPPNYSSNYGLTLAASWEVDLWGSMRT